jgi:hypothetical protein
MIEDVPSVEKDFSALWRTFNIDFSAELIFE